jgi:cyanophycin synthetase
MPGFNDRLLSWLPSLIEHRCSEGERGGFLQRLRRGTYLAHILEHVTLELQTLAGTPVGYGRARPTSEEGVYKVVFEYEEEDLARECLRVARELCLAAVEDRPFALPAELQRLQALYQSLKLDATTTAIVNAARQRKIPVQRLPEEQMLQLGYGIRQHRIGYGPALVSTTAPETQPAAAVPPAPPYLLSAGSAPQSVDATCLDKLYPDGQTGRVPIISVTGVNGKTTTTRLIAHIVARSHRCVGMTCTEGIYVGGRRIEAGDCSGPRSAQAILQHPTVEAAVLEVARGGILRAGLGFDWCDVAVVTNIAEGDHLGLADIDTPEKLAQVKRCIVEVVKPEGAAVLKADDPLVADMANHCPGSPIFFARDGHHPVIVEHRRKQGRVAFVRDNRIILAEGHQEIPLVPLEAVPLTHGGRIGFQIENALAAAAATWALGIPCEVIRAGLESFQTSLDTTPGRFNVLAINEATVIMDYGHNVSSLSCLIDTLKQLPHRRRSALYTAAGDRRDSDMIGQGKLLGEAFDRVILYEDDTVLRERKPGEIISLFRQGLAHGRRVAEIHEVYGAVKAAEVTLRSARPGELVLVQVDHVDETVELVQQFLLEAGGREIQFNEAMAMAHRHAAAVSGA